MQHSFETPTPPSLYVELGSGDLTVRAAEVGTTDVHVDGPDAEDVVVEQRGDQIVVLAPKRRVDFLSAFSHDLTVQVSLPHDSDLSTRLGSAGMVATGRYAAVHVESGSGDVHVDDITAAATLKSGSGDVDLSATHDDTRVKTGSGDVAVERAAGPLQVATGSGDVALGETRDAVSVKSGSGDVEVVDAHTDITVTTASGTVSIGRFRQGAFQARAVSGDVRVGVPTGVPVWTDINSITGSVHSDLRGGGQPEEGQDYAELRVSTVSGDVHLAER